MQTGQHIDRIAINHVKERVRKLVKVSAPQVLHYAGVQVGVAAEKFTGAPQLVKKYSTHLDVVLLIPDVSLVYLQLRQWFKDDRKGHAQCDLSRSIALS